MAEAHFLRGLYYFQLVRLYGGVPIYRNSFDGDLAGTGFRPARGTAAEVYALIEEDFEIAATDLPQKYGDADLGRATAGAAQAYLGRALLYQEKYADAATALARIIAGDFGTYTLVDFEKNFDADNENNAESIFEVQFQTGIGNGFSDGDTRLTAESNWIATALNPGRQRAFANGIPSLEVDGFFRQFPGDSLRRFQTIVRPGDTWGSWRPVAANPVTANQWQARTGEVPGRPFTGVRKGTEGPFPVGFVQSPRNARIFRFAEVLLLYAEAENEANGPTAAAYSAINRVRTRAKVPALPTGLSKDDFFARLVEERPLLREVKVEAEVEIEQYLAGLIKAMDEERVYVDSDLNEKMLADHLGIPSYILSRLLNERIGKSFSLYINEYRVGEARRLLRE